MSAAPDVYVSYAPEDVIYVTLVVHSLRAHVNRLAGREIDISGIGVDPSRLLSSLSAGASASVMLAFMSRGYLRSARKRREFAEFASRGRPIVTAILSHPHPPGPEELKELLGGRESCAAPELSIVQRDVSSDLVRNLAEKIVSALEPARRAALQAEIMAYAKGDLFLSYAEQDADFLRILCPFLKKRGYDYWEYGTSRRDHQKRLGPELEHRIKKADATVAILSNAWKASEWAPDEVSFARRIGKPVLLLMAKPMEETLGIGSRLYIDFTKSSDKAFADLARALADL